jgi:acetyltransferase-like isoleucine patch superfamily enzyme
VTAPQVLIMDHAHEFSDIRVPILHQGVTQGGRIIIERGCWIGFGAAILCNRGVLRIGRNAVVGANSVVTRDIPPCTVVVGAPARATRRYDDSLSRWVRVAATALEKEDTPCPGRSQLK